MDRADYIQLFSTPDVYRPPEDKNLYEDTGYPNLNSRNYRKYIENDPRFPKFLESLDVNEEGIIIIAANAIVGRTFNGNIHGYDDFQKVNDSQSCFKLNCESPVTKVKFFQKKIFFAAHTNGSLNMWSTQSEARDADGYCLFKIGSRTEHLGLISDMEVLLPSRNKAVTGSSDCALKIWDASAADLICTSTMRYAHSNDIVGISSCPYMDEVFASCSRDKTAVIWDHRQPRPAKGLYGEHGVPFSTIYWSSEVENKGCICLGDESGCLNFIDTKMPKKFISQMNVFNRPIRKIKYERTSAAVIGNTNMIYVYDEALNLVYQNNDSKNLIRDIYWMNDNLLISIGWDAKLRINQIKKNNLIILK